MLTRVGVAEGPERHLGVALLLDRLQDARPGWSAGLVDGRAWSRPATIGSCGLADRTSVGSCGDGVQRSPATLGRHRTVLTILNSLTLVQDRTMMNHRLQLTWVCN